MDSSLTILDPSLRIGLVSGVNSKGIDVNLMHVGQKSASYHLGGRYGRGEVGEIVLIEGQTILTIGKIIDVRLPEKERSQLNPTIQEESIDGVSFVQILGSVNIQTLSVTAGVDDYPRIGDVVYSATAEFLSRLPQLTEKNLSTSTVELTAINIGCVPGSSIDSVQISPEKLFGRHCAILGSTGGGKSWTTARIIQECAKFPKAKVIILDATGEYRNLSSEYTTHMHIGTPLNQHEESTPFSIPPTDFNESDFLTLFEPSGKVQGPKLRAAIRSLRLARLAPDAADNGVIKKIRQDRTRYRKALSKYAANVDDPSEPFDVNKLVEQIVEECHHVNNDGSWGNRNDAEVSYCSSLFTRIIGVIKSHSFSPVFNCEGISSLGSTIDNFMNSEQKILRLCLSSTSYEFNARQILANVIGRKLMNYARNERFINRPLLAVIDEAHNFLGKKVGFEEYSIHLDAFEIIAKEGRKYGLNICLTTQRPRDITEGVLSQMGTMLVHRLTNSNDREIIEKACGEVDRSIISFLPNLKQGEVTVVGVDFPIPLTIQVHRPTPPPMSDSPSYQKLWS
ncbi:ATP-binding protein [Vibrio vulnificus]|uniref:ATP-binding protein n=1 Tax=Vibrio vulnificus TaxID=672 RepID=UPI000CD22485|nr:ATP-binding protein [Vibrio vulnificus]ELI0374545.1 ATP-binding protein [Vibrio cholerae]AVX01876.1 cell division protein FtsK [Vibrio vulnificus Env1]EGR0070512.1 ATP-binding protein [Vibrio vulnificus]MCA3901030.1 ATP-binding protein [Vibrio vulnificus]MCA3925979.1 ATP-binding protein [Vibrio vulnificus]